jgi:deoxycytidylate deaminase
VSIILHDRIRRPSIDEAAMHAAYSAQLQSSCLSRQVGAALVDERGNIVATGTNEVPKAGGGVYGEDLEPGGVENRCAFCENAGAGPFCSNNARQNELIEEALKALFGDEIPPNELQEKLIAVRKTQLGGLLEFSRSVHAEMDALLSAGRSGVSTIGSRLFVTTYPCHYCARHIVSAGVYEVQYIEPYPKSRAIDMHGDAIESVPENWIPPQRRSRHDEVMARPDGEQANLISPIRPGIAQFSQGKLLTCKGRGRRKRRKSAVVPTKSILKAANVPIIGGHHVPALQGSPEGWQATPLLERCREHAGRQGARGAAARAVPG